MIGEGDEDTMRTPRAKAATVWLDYARRRNAETHTASAALEAVARAYGVHLEEAAELIDQHVASQPSMVPQMAWWCRWHHCPLDDDALCPRRVVAESFIESPFDRSQRRLDRMVGLSDASAEVSPIATDETAVHADPFVSKPLGQVVSDAAMENVLQPTGPYAETFDRLGKPTPRPPQTSDAERADEYAYVDHPAHYGGADDPFEPIKIIEAKGLGFHEGNALKYLFRSGYKPGESRSRDLRKAAWYLDRLADYLEESDDGV